MGKFWLHRRLRRARFGLEALCHMEWPSFTKSRIIASHVDIQSGWSDKAYDINPLDARLKASLGIEFIAHIGWCGTGNRFQHKMAALSDVTDEDGRRNAFFLGSITSGESLPDGIISLNFISVLSNSVASWSFSGKFETAFSLEQKNSCSRFLMENCLLLVISRGCCALLFLPSGLRAVFI